MTEKVLCERCGKEIVGKYAYMSRLDTNLVCQECWDKEQPKELIKRIAELEEENEAYQKEINDFCNKRYFGCLEDADKKLAELEEENKQRAYIITTYRKDIDNCIKTIEELKQENEELKAKLEEVEGQYAYECECNKQLVELQEENAKLQEQLKNSIVPKFKVGQIIWFIDEDDGEIRDARVLSIEIESTCLLYTILWADFCELYRQEEFLFATEAEAQKYLEEHK